MECKIQKGQTVVPVFYHVEPSDVRNQTGSFGEAFDKYQKVPEHKLMRWKAALRHAANLSGWQMYESQAIQRIVQNILSRNLKLLSASDKLVGMERHLKEMASLISIDSNDVRMIGINGIDGIGKTTLAKAVYNQIVHQFDGASFLSNFSSHEMNLLQLQKQLLRDILGEDIPRITDISKGAHVIRDMLWSKKVLVVLDDVDGTGQLEFLVINRAFGPGSRIIVTSRHKYLLAGYGLDALYEVKELNCKEAIQLFALHAFHMNSPQKGFINLSRCIVDYCKGLPIALEVLVVGKLFGEQYHTEPGKWSRLWDPEDVYHVLTTNTISPLGWMDLESLPSNFDGWKLVELSLKHSSLKHLWNSCLPKLEVINLVTKLKRLTILNMKNCKMLHYFPSITGLESLKVLNLSGCSKLDKFPEIQGYMEYLLELNLEGTAIVELPLQWFREVSGNHGGYGVFTKASFRWNISKRAAPLNSNCQRDLGRLQFLMKLQADGTAITQPPLSLFHLRNLKELSFRDVKDQHLTLGFHPFYSDLSGCNLTDRSINENLGHLHFLEELNLSRNNLVTVPAEFYLHSRHSTYRFLLPSSCNFQTAELLRPLAQDNGATILEKLRQNFLPEIEYSIVLPGSTIPEWFQHPSIGSSVTIELPPNGITRTSWVLLYALCSHLRRMKSFKALVSFVCNFEFREGPYLSSSISWTHSGDRVIETDHIWLVYQPGAKLMMPNSSRLNKFRKITAYFSLSGASHVVKNVESILYTPEIRK
ncbi:TMV resistance protein N [Vitis vinifera]|uniref:ADP-ribosyl cyclase/cyclic ADP-ribose hydrolase n=1 Tax=Vitis vinifera TaxID=29760 RepID=A0A438IQJ5_VITVI|nr:TMV resistance protein N [Vitis vinifera]